jgi:hypothetical protein
VDDAYEIAHNIRNIRVAQGEQPIGRKIGFVVRKNWERYGIIDDARIPTWAPMYDTTVRFAEDNHGAQSLTGAVQPHRPEIVFKLGKTPAAGASLIELADCLEWMAHGFEIVVCPFPNWEFTVADSIAAFGLHGTLIVGEPHVLSSAIKHPQIRPAQRLPVLQYGVVQRAARAGFCNDEMDSPCTPCGTCTSSCRSSPASASCRPARSSAPAPGPMPAPSNPARPGPRPSRRDPAGPDGVLRLKRANAH